MRRQKFSFYCYITLLIHFSSSFLQFFDTFNDRFIITILTMNGEYNGKHIRQKFDNSSRGVCICKDLSENYSIQKKNKLGEGDKM